jgi:hypothetical protein
MTQKTWWMALAGLTLAGGAWAQEGAKPAFRPYYGAGPVAVGSALRSAAPSGAASAKPGPCRCGKGEAPSCCCVKKGEDGCGGCKAAPGCCESGCCAKCCPAMGVGCCCPCLSVLECILDVLGALFDEDYSLPCPAPEACLPPPPPPYPPHMTSTWGNPGCTGYSARLPPCGYVQAAPVYSAPMGAWHATTQAVPTPTLAPCAPVACEMAPPAMARPAVACPPQTPGGMYYTEPMQVPYPMPMPPMPPMPNPYPNLYPNPYPVPMPPAPPVVVQVPVPMLPAVRFQKVDGEGCLVVAAGGASLSCKKMKLECAGGSIDVAAGKAHVLVSSGGVKASADQVQVEGADACLTLVGHVHVTITRDGKTTKTHADKARLDVRTGQMKTESCDVSLSE